MSPVPLYQPRSEDGAYQLRYSWTAWPSGVAFEQQPVHLVEETKPHWERDGLRVLEHRWTEKIVQILFSCPPDIAPQFVAERAKGRLDHALRTAGIAMPFSRKLALRAVGDNTRGDVEAYIEGQVGNRHFADPRFASKLAALTVIDQKVDLSQPAESARGRYWCNLHLVLVIDGHAPIHNIATLHRLRDAFFRIAAKKGHAVSRLSVLPDHLHAAVRWCPSESPLDVVFAYQNNLAHMAEQGRIWSPGFYVGTFGEYTTQAVRNA